MEARTVPLGLAAGEFDEANTALRGSQMRRFYRRQHCRGGRR